MRPARRSGSLLALVAVVALGLTAHRAVAWARPGRTAETQAQKFDRVERFARRGLPGVRRQVTADLREPALDRSTAVAAIVRIMDSTSMRVGSEAYTTKPPVPDLPSDRQPKPSYGASSLRKSQVDVDGETITFHFDGKSRTPWVVAHRDPVLARAIRVFLATPGDRLFVLPEGPVTERHVRAFLRPHGGLPKDLRTHNANRLLRSELRRLDLAGVPRTSASRAAAIRRVAGALHHTPAVSERFYLDPRILDAYLPPPTR